MTNPNNSVGTNGAYGGRTSVVAFNDVLGAFSGRGIISGWAANPSSGMTISLGGQSGVRDVAIAEDNSGNRTTVNNILEAPVPLALSAAPSTNSRIDAIVAYVDNPPEGTATALDNPGACGLIAVSSTASANPSVPDDSAIRSAITADGASGSTAFYVVLATVRVASGTTTITANMLTAGGGTTASGLGLAFNTTSATVLATTFSTTMTDLLSVSWANNTRRDVKLEVRASLNVIKRAGDYISISLTDGANNRLSPMTYDEIANWHPTNLAAVTTVSAGASITIKVRGQAFGSATNTSGLILADPSGYPNYLPQITGIIVG